MYMTYCLKAPKYYYKRLTIKTYFNNFLKYILKFLFKLIRAIKLNKNLTTKQRHGKALKLYLIAWAKLWNLSFLFSILQTCVISRTIFRSYRLFQIVSLLRPAILLAIRQSSCLVTSFWFDLYMESNASTRLLLLKLLSFCDCRASETIMKWRFVSQYSSSSLTLRQLPTPPSYE